VEGNIYKSWQEVTANTMRTVWKYLLPYCTNDLYGFENRVDAVMEEINVIGKDISFEDVDLPSVRECLYSYSQPITDKDLIGLKQQRT
jgi:hypothetical protein